MSVRRFFFSLISAIFVLVMAACGSAPAGGSTPASGSTSVPPPSSGSGACTNPWEPVKAGALWNYNITGITNATDARTIETVSADGFTDQNVFSNGITLPGTWKCSNGALTDMDPFSTAPTGTSSAQALHTDSVDGTGLPAGTKPGDSFQLTYHMSGSVTENGTAHPLTEVVSESCKADAMQSVTVAAGTFDALHLTCQLGLTITATIAGAPSTPIVSNSTIQRWFAKGVGLVKSVDTSSAGVRTTDLTSYTIP
ncbi:MAG: hypothetical protein ABSG01_14855 [Anaerolineales bacterium]